MEFCDLLKTDFKDDEIWDYIVDAAIEAGEVRKEDKEKIVCITVVIDSVELEKEG